MIFSKSAVRVHRFYSDAMRGKTSAS